MNGTGIGFGNESGSASSTTTSGISGIAGDQTIRSDKDSSNVLVKTWNGEELQQDMEAQANIMQEATKQVSVATVYRVIQAATADKKLLLQKCDSGGQNCQNTKVDLADVKVVDGKIYVYNNGIMNSEKQALDNAAKQSSDAANAQGVYVIINPYTGNPIAEVLYAGWDKLNEILGAALPISNASKANIDIREQAKEHGGVVVEVDHSRGSLTSSNAVAEQLNRGVTNVAIGNVTFNGAAANAERMADRVNQATSGQGQVFQSTHKDDPVGTMIGGNVATGGNTIKFPDSHGAYSGYLPPAFIGERENERRELTDQAWGPGKINIPTLVPSTNTVGITQGKR